MGVTFLGKLPQLPSAFLAANQISRPCMPRDHLCEEYSQLLKTVHVTRKYGKKLGIPFAAALQKRVLRAFGAIMCSSPCDQV